MDMNVFTYVYHTHTHTHTCVCVCVCVVCVRASALARVNITCAGISIDVVVSGAGARVHLAEPHDDHTADHTQHAHGAHERNDSENHRDLEEQQEVGILSLVVVMALLRHVGPDQHTPHREHCSSAAGDELQQKHRVAVWIDTAAGRAEWWRGRNGVGRLNVSKQTAVVQCTGRTLSLSFSLTHTRTRARAHTHAHTHAHTARPFALSLARALSVLTYLFSSTVLPTWLDVLLRGQQQCQ